MTAGRNGRIRPLEHGPEGAPVVVLVHGAPDRGRSFSAVTELLADLRVVVYDRRGYGESIGVGSGAASLTEHADDLIEVLAGRRATLVGHSFGANVAMLAAIRRPRAVAALGLWEPPLPWFDWWPAWARQVIADIAAHPDPGRVGERAYKVVAGRQAWEQLSEEGRAQCRSEGPAFLADTASQLAAPFDLSALRAPAIVGFGTATWEHQVDGAARLASMLGADLFALEGADHFAHAGQPEGFARFVRAAVALAGEGSGPRGG